MAALGSLVVKLALEYAEYTKGLNKSDQETLQFAQRVQANMDAAGQATTSFFTGIATGAIGAIAAYGAVGLVLDKLNNSIDALAKLDDLNQQLGTSVETLSRIQKVTVAYGADFNVVTDAATKLAKGMAATGEEGGKTERALKAIGLSAKDSAGKLRDPADVMIEVAKSLQGYQDGANKAALVSDLFGKSGAKLLPFLNDLADNVDKFTGASAKSASQAAAFQDELGQMKVRTAELWTVLATNLLPTLSDFTGALNDVASKSSKVAGDGSLASWADNVALSIARLYDWMQSFSESAGVYYANLKTMAAAADLVNPWSKAKASYDGRDLFAEFKEAFEERNKIADDANKKLADIEKNGRTTMEAALKARIAQRATDSKNADGEAPKDGTAPDKKPLPYTSAKEKNPKAAKTSDYTNLTRSINEKIAADKLEIETVGDATQGEKLATQVRSQLEAGTIKMTETERKRVFALLDQLVVEDKAVEAKQKQEKTTKALQYYVEQQTIAINDSAAALAVEYAMYGKSSDARDIAMVGVKNQTAAEKEIAKLKKDDPNITQAQIDKIKEETAARAAAEQATMAQSKALSYAAQLGDENKKFAADSIVDEKQRAAALLEIDADTWRERIRLAGDGTDAQKQLQDRFDTWYQNQLLKPQIDRNKKMAEQLDTDFHDGIENAFQGGEKPGKALVKTVANTLKTSLADVLYQTFARQYVVQIEAAVSGIFNGGTAAATSAGGAGNTVSELISNASTLYSAYDKAGSIASWLGIGSSALGSGITTTATTAALTAPGVGSLGSGLALGSNAAGSTIGGGALGGGLAAPSASTIGSVGGEMAGETAASGLSGTAYGGIGIAGAIGAGLLYGNKGYSAAGGGIGAAGGAYIGTAVFPVLGTAAGAVIGTVLGGALGSLFGDEDGPDTKMTFASNASKYGEGMIDGDWSRKSALGDFGLTDNYWSSYAEFPNATKSFLDTVQGMDNSLAASLTDTERATAQAAVSATPITLATGYEHSDPTQVYAAAAVQRAMTVLNSVDTGLSKFVDLTSGTVSDVLTQINGLLAIRKKLAADGDVADFGSAVTIDQIDALKLSGETISTTFTRLVDTFNATNVAAQLVGRNADEMFGAVGFASEKARTSLVNLFGGASKLVSALSTYSQNYLSDAERSKIASDQLSKSLADMGVTGVTTKDQFRALVSAQDLTTDAGRDLYAKLINISSAFATVADAVGATDKAMNDAAISAASAAYDSLKKSVEADRTKVTTAYQDTVDSLNAQVDTRTNKVSDGTAFLSSLQSTLKSMSSSLDAQASTNRASAQAQIAAALAIAKAGGPLPTSDSLSDALGVVSQQSDQLFSSSIDYQKDFLETANNIADLAGLTDAGLSTDKAQLKALQEQLAQNETAYNAQMASFDAVLAGGQQQLDALNGISTNVLSLADATKAFAAAVLSAKTQVTSTGGAAASPSSALEVLYQDLLGRGSDADGLAYWKSELTNGGNIDDIKREIMGSSEYLALHPPAFALGGDHVGGLRIVGENGPELEATGPSRIFTANQTRNILQGGAGSSNAELVAEMRALRQEVVRLQNLQAQGNDNTREANNAARRPQPVEIVGVDDDVKMKMVAA